MGRRRRVELPTRRRRRRHSQSARRRRGEVSCFEWCGGDNLSCEDPQRRHLHSDLPAVGLPAYPQQWLRLCGSLCLLGTAWPLFTLVTLHSSTVRSWTGWNSYESYVLHVVLTLVCPALSAVGVAVGRVWHVAGPFTAVWFIVVRRGVGHGARGSSVWSDE